MSAPNQIHLGWLEEIETNGVNTTAWEDEFVESIREQVDAGRPLSDRQAEILERIFAERTP